MDIYFQDPSEVPLPPEEVRIRLLHAEPMADGRRIKVHLEVDPFQRRPSAELLIRTADGEERASTSIVESMTRKMEVTMHLRGAPPPGRYSLQAILFYSQAVEPEGDQPEDELPRQTHTIVDRAETTFDLTE